MPEALQDTDPTEQPVSVGEHERRRTIGRLAGTLFSVGAALSFVSSLLLEPPLASWLYLLIVLGFCSGITCLVIPWGRLSPRWIHLVAILATVEVSVAVWMTGVHGSLYSWLYMFIAIMVAYSFRSRRTVAAYLVFISAGLAAPIVDPPVSARESLRNILVSIPSLVVAAMVVTYFRERLEAGQRALRQLASLDPLTGVGNYRTLHERLNHEFGRHRRHGRRLAVTVLDLDNFKDVNSTHGHLEGDRVLRDVGRALSGAVRAQDTVARQGGDEFSVLAPESGALEVMALVERLRRALGAVEVGDRVLTATVGWAIYPDDGLTPEALLTRADSLLLEQKRAQPEAAQAKPPPSRAPLRLPADAGGRAVSASGDAQ